MVAILEANSTVLNLVVILTGPFVSVLSSVLRITKARISRPNKCYDVHDLLIF